MFAAQRHNFHRAPLGWTSAMNLFSLMFALLLALRHARRTSAPAPPAGA